MMKPILFDIKQGTLKRVAPSRYEDPPNIDILSDEEL